MNKEQAKEKIEKLIKRYEDLSEAEKKKCNERETIEHFIRPLFEALGWNFERDAWPETDVSGKRVDYALKIDGITKLYIEAKPISANLDEERWAEQAINYSWHKSVPWVILTDFEGIKVFNTEWDEPDIQSCRFIEIFWNEYLTSEKLWWLSREAFEKGLLDKKADEVGRRPKRIIDDQLASDLIQWRELLYKDLCGYNPKIAPKKILEYVQKILDRLIFIRTLEDRKIEDVILQPLVRDWEQGGSKADQLLLSLNKVFRKIDKTYDSGLFEEGPYDYLGDKLDGTDGTFAEVIEALYKTKGRGIRYNFADIPADIFGSIYEQYLGHIQQEEVEDKKTSKRKSQGIYYTPRYIVNYIAQNTLGEILKTKTPTEIRNLKILDPACGSGSFLIVAYQTLLDYWGKQKGKQIKEKNGKFRDIEKAFKKRNGNIISPQEKMRILLNNIFGVDLDEEAVELARLNLLLKMVGAKIKLPKLANNIQEGNSLISGAEKELKKYFGKTWKDKKPFEWDKKFDVVIGTPPYIDSEEIVREDKNFRLYCADKYDSAKGNWDIFCVFMQKGLDLLREDGYFGMIVPNKLLSADYANSIREIIKRYSVIAINDYSKVKVFGASVYPIVIIVKKVKPDKSHNIVINSYEEDNEQIKLTNSKKVKQTVLEVYKKSWSPIFDYTKEVNFVDKICKKAKKLNEFCSIHGAATVNEAYQIKEIIKNLTEEKDCFKFINTGTIDRYTSLWDSQKTQYIKSAYLKPVVAKSDLRRILPTRYKESEKNKIIIAGMVKNLECFLDEKGEYLAGKSTTIIEGDKIDLKFILAILNSKLLTFIYRNIFKSLSLAGGYLRIGTPQIKELPIIVPPEIEVDKISRLADKMLKLNRELQKLDPIMEEKEYKEIKEEIEKTDKEIDEKIYELYGLTEGERKIVEGK